MDSWPLPDPTTCERCKAQPAALPLVLADGRPSGHLCRDCLVQIHTLGFNALAGVFGPVPAMPTEFLLDSELFWIDAATQEPRTLSLETIRTRWHELLARKHMVRPEHMKVDPDLLNRWPDGG